MSHFADDDTLALIESMKQQLAERDKRIVLLRPLLARASEAIGRFTSDEGWAQTDMDTMDDIDSTLAATDDLSGYILCDAEPVGFKSIEYGVLSESKTNQRDIPLYKAKTP